MTVPVDISDTRIAKAYAHPIRIEILTRLENRVASASEIAREIDASLPLTSYHFRKLASFGLIELVKQVPRRGSVESYYTAKVRPTITDEGWAQTARVVKRAIISGRLRQTAAEIAEAADHGGFDGDDIHLSRTALRLTSKGWTEISRALAQTLETVDSVASESAAALEEDSDQEAEEATVVLMFFRSAPADEPRRAGAEIAEPARAAS